MSGSSSSTSPFAGRRVLLAPESAPSSHSGSWDAGRIGASSIRGLCLLRPCDLGGTSWDAAGRRGISSIRGLCRLRPCELGRAVSKSLSGSSIGEVDDGLTSSCAACPPQTQQTLSTPQRRSLRRAVRLVDDRTFRKNGCFYTDNSAAGGTAVYAWSRNLCACTQLGSCFWPARLFLCFMAPLPARVVS